MRILLACAAFPPFGRGGGPVASELLAKSLVLMGAEVRVVVVGDDEAAERRDGMEIVTVRSLNVYRDYVRPNPTLKKLAWHLLENYNPRAYRRMREELRSFHPDVMVTISIENINVASWAAAHDENIPCVHIAHSYFLMCWRGSLFRDGQNCTRCGSCKLLSIGKKFLSRHVDALITESEFLQRTHVDAGYFQEAAHYVIPSPVDAPVVPRSEKPPGLRVGYLGTHTRNKGIETLAAAANRLVDHPGIQFLIAGSGDADYTAELMALFPKANTTFVGWVRSDDFYSQIDIIVVPSVWREPFGRASVEGTLFGVPAVVARSGGLAENVVHGVDGLIFNPRDDAALAALLSQVDADPSFYRSLSDGARKRAPSYSLRAVGTRLAACLETVVAQKQQSEQHSVLKAAL